MTTFVWNPPDPTDLVPEKDLLEVIGPDAEIKAETTDERWIIDASELPF